MNSILKVIWWFCFSFFDLNTMFVPAMVVPKHSHFLRLINRICILFLTFNFVVDIKLPCAKVWTGVFAGCKVGSAQAFVQKRFRKISVNCWVVVCFPSQCFWITVLFRRRVLEFHTVVATTDSCKMLVRGCRGPLAPWPRRARCQPHLLQGRTEFRRHCVGAIWFWIKIWVHGS